MRIVHFAARPPGIALALLASLALVSGAYAAPQADAVIDGILRSGAPTSDTANFAGFSSYSLVCSQC